MLGSIPRWYVHRCHREHCDYHARGEDELAAAAVSNVSWERRTMHKCSPAIVADRGIVEPVGRYETVVPLLDNSDRVVLQGKFE